MKSDFGAIFHDHYDLLGSFIPSMKDSFNLGSDKFFPKLIFYVTSVHLGSNVNLQMKKQIFFSIFSVFALFCSAKLCVQMPITGKIPMKIASSESSPTHKTFWPKRNSKI